MQADSEREAEFMGLSSFLKRALKKLCEVFLGRRDRLTSTDPETLEQSSTLSRFIFSRKQYNVDRPKPNAFLPPSTNLAISAIWIDNLSDTEIWRIGDDVVGRARNKPALARADIEAKILADVSLTILPDPEPHPRHVNILGWPTEKDERLAVALELCAKSILRIR
jgi:hypothetical protein